MRKTKQEGEGENAENTPEGLDCASSKEWATTLRAVPAPHNSADSPVMRQYLNIKSQYSDSVVMFRMGDFYELFFDDALRVAPMLDIAVTTRDKKAEDPVPMAGVPYHAIGGYLRTLVEQGVKVAIVEQMESPEEARKRKGAQKIVHREVVRVVSPGALLDEDHLQSGVANYMVSICHRKGDGQKGGEKGEIFAISALDISSGDFQIMSAWDSSGLRTELARLSPRELLVNADLGKRLEKELGPDCPRLELLEENSAAAMLSRVKHLYAENGDAQRALSEAEVQAAARSLGYAESTQPGQSLLLHRLRRHIPGEHLALDDTSLRNLEIYRTSRDGQRKGSLLWAVDETRTSMGARLLREWLGAPLRNLEEIHRRQEGIEALLGESRLRDELQSRLKDVRDIVRLAARARLKTISPRELAALRDSLIALPDLQELLLELAKRRTDGQLPQELCLQADILEDIRELLEHTMVDKPPTITREGGFIRPGADKALDEQMALGDGGRQALAAIELREREATQIPNLKIHHNRVFGYFIEVGKSHLAKVPKEYVRKQTLANAERYVTEELAQLETKVLGAQTLALARELTLFAEIREQVSQAGERLMLQGQALAKLDVLAGLAKVAEHHGYVRPQLVEEAVLDIEEGRHPVVERMLDSGQFVPNDVALKAHGGPAQPRLMILTGPNMGGKSTVMRQVALISILAHMGSFVPARSARIGWMDRIFTRVGAADDLSRGESTFMVEMRETAQIVAEATARSLVLLDEVGRGTATFDGVALAWALSEHLHDQICCRVMFATHYHELCGLEKRLPGVCNRHVAVHEQRGGIVFLHRLDDGPAGRSYGVQVGRLAGLPQRLLRRAARILERLEQRDAARSGPQMDLFTPLEERKLPKEFESEELREVEREALEMLRDCDLDELSPRQAHELLRNGRKGLRTKNDGRCGWI